MRVEDILDLPSMPLASPSYPRGPYRFINREFMVISYETDADAIRHAKEGVISFSPAIAEANRVIKEFLFARMYRHWRVNRMTAKARKVTSEIFTLLHNAPNLLPDDWRGRAGDVPGTARCAQAVADYIAGMTDRFALDEHLRLTDITVSG